METNVRAKGPKAFIAKICAVLFLLIMIVFTLYPIVYTVLGSLKTNAELTAGGSFCQSPGSFKTIIRRLSRRILSSTPETA